MNLSERNHFVGVCYHTSLDSTVVIFQLTDEILVAILVFDEGVVGEGNIEDEGMWFGLIHEPFEVVSTLLYNFFLT